MNTKFIFQFVAYKCNNRDKRLSNCMYISKIKYTETGNRNMKQEGLIKITLNFNYQFILPYHSLYNIFYIHFSSIK